MINQSASRITSFAIFLKARTSKGPQLGVYPSSRARKTSPAGHRPFAHSQAKTQNTQETQKKRGKQTRSSTQDIVPLPSLPPQQTERAYPEPGYGWTTGLQRDSSPNPNPKCQTQMTRTSLLRPTHTPPPTRPATRRTSNPPAKPTRPVSSFPLLLFLLRLLH
jgi:hypothetical protein